MARKKKVYKRGKPKKLRLDKKSFRAGRKTLRNRRDPKTGRIFGWSVRKRRRKKR